MFFTSDVSREAAVHAQRCGAETRQFGPLKAIGIGALNESTIAEPVENDPTKQVAVLIYTSGTTGTPKGVMLTHDNLLVSAGTTAHFRRMGSSDKVYIVLPISHIVGISLLIMTLMVGGTVRLVSKYDPAALTKAMAEEGITILNGVPATYQRLLEYKTVAGLARLDRGSLRLIAVAGALILPPTRSVIFEAVRPLSSGSYYELATGRGVLFAAQVIAYQRATLPQKIIGRGLHSTPGINRQFAPMLLEDAGSPELNEGNVGAHNQYLRVLTESGIVGLLVFATVIALSMRDAVRAAFRSTRTIDRTAGMGVLLLLCAMCLYGLSGTPLDLPSIAWPTWFAVGMASGIAVRQIPKPPEAG